MAEGKKVLVIEDDPAIQMVLKSGLSKRGFTVLTASDGMEGLNTARGELPDLVLSDVMLPKMDGYKIASFLKMDQKTKGIPIIMLTAKGQQADKETGMKTGAAAYIVKPFKMLDLLEVVDRVLSEATS